MALPTPQEERYYEQLRQTRRDRYRKANASLSAFPEVAFIGDSITELFPLERYLKSQKLMANRGISASRSDNILDHLDCHLPGSFLNQIFLMIGVNDLGYGVTFEQSLANVKGLIESISAQYPFAVIYLMEILPVSEEQVYAKTVGLRTNDGIKALNRAYQSLADDYANVTFLPTYQAFLDNKGQLQTYLTVDGLHLNSEGYTVLACLIQPYLE